MNNLKMLYKTGHLDVLWHRNRFNNLHIDTASWPVALYGLLGLRNHSLNLVEEILKKKSAAKTTTIVIRSHLRWSVALPILSWPVAVVSVPMKSAWTCPWNIIPVVALQIA